MTGDPMRRLPNAIFVSACSCFALILGLALGSPRASAQALAPVCHPTVSGPVVVETHDQIIAAGLRAVPPITDTGGFGFAWPDTQMGVIKTGNGTGSIAPYPYSVGLGDDPRILGNPFYVYYTHLQLENGGLPRKGDSLRRLTLTCP
jgi:hypothetical protein